MPGSPMQNSMFNKTEGYVQKRNPFPVSSCGRRRNLGYVTICDDVNGVFAHPSILSCTLAIDS